MVALAPAALAVFLGAFLLFQIQPILGKQILPWFGGSAAVWTTALAFFQTALLAGYALTHLLVRRLSPRAQAATWAALLAASLLVLPIAPDPSWRPENPEFPALRILALLAVTIGPPYVLLASTSPLMQAWIARMAPTARPYRLFALSNLASLGGLLSYPFLIEPLVGVSAQTWIWSAGYCLFALAGGVVALGVWRTAAPVAAAAPATVPGPRPPATDYLFWMALAGLGSALLVAGTNHLTQDIAPVPLLWILPLSLYLLTFVLCFESDRIYRPLVFAVLFALSLLFFALVAIDPRSWFGDLSRLGAVSLTLAFGWMTLHGELARSRPAPAHLTGYYLALAAGGAAGGLAVAVGAPLATPADFDIYLVLLIAANLVLWSMRAMPLVAPAAIAVGMLGCAMAFGYALFTLRTDLALAQRTFYGALTVKLYELPDGTPMRSLLHGIIMHGDQMQSEAGRRMPTQYYRRESGVGRFFSDEAAAPRRVGVVGLGAGSMAAWGRAGDVFRFYELNPAIVDIAHTQFTYIADSRGKIEIVLGDARLSLEREPPQAYDLLAVDAFSSDAIPVHLLTREAVGVYLRHLKPNGVLALHVTNRYLNLLPAAKALADAHGLHAVYMRDQERDSWRRVSDWVLLSRSAEALHAPTILEGSPQPLPPPARVWTDDYSHLLGALLEN